MVGISFAYYPKRESGNERMSVEECARLAKETRYFTITGSGEIQEIEGVRGKCFRELNGHVLCKGCVKASV